MNFCGSHPLIYNKNH